VSQKTGHPHPSLAHNLPNVDRFSQFFHHKTQQQTCNETVITDPTTPQTRRYTTLWKINARKLLTIRNN